MSDGRGDVRAGCVRRCDGRGRVVVSAVVGASDAPLGDWPRRSPRSRAPTGCVSVGDAVGVGHPRRGDGDRHGLAGGVARWRHGRDGVACRVDGLHRRRWLGRRWPTARDMAAGRHDGRRVAASGSRRVVGGFRGGATARDGRGVVAAVRGDERPHRRTDLPCGTGAGAGGSRRRVGYRRCMWRAVRDTALVWHAGEGAGRADGRLPRVGDGAVGAGHGWPRVGLGDPRGAGRADHCDATGGGLDREVGMRLAKASS